jgi:hypothetical protein
MSQVNTHAKYLKMVTFGVMQILYIMQNLIAS